MGFNIGSMLQEIEDMVLVEDKIVTYRHVTMQLRVHINTAKQLLYAFIKKPDLKEKLLVTYIVSGFTKDNTQLISLVRAETLDKIKEDYSKVTSEHVYSVQKYTPKPSEKDYYIAEMETLNLDKEYSSIRIEEDITRKTERPVNIPPPQVDNLKKPAPKPTTNQPIKSPKKSVNLFAKKQNLKEEKKTEPKEEKQELTKNSNSIKEESDTAKTKQASPKKNEKGSKKNVVQKGGGIGAFFSKQAASAVQTKKEPPKKIEVSNKENEKNNVEEYDRMEEDPPPPSKEEVKVNGDHQKSTSDKTPVGKNKKNAKKKDAGKKRKSSVSHEEPKRRKRIMMTISDSESSDDGMSVDEEEERVPSPEPAPVPVIDSEDEIIPPTPVAKGRKKVRKQVEKTFKDEEGFVLTRKEYVYESCTDEDEPPPSKVETPKKSKEVKQMETTKSPIKENTKENQGKGRKKSKGSPTSKTSPQKNKQASIMSFFGKK